MMSIYMIVMLALFYLLIFECIELRHVDENRLCAFHGFRYHLLDSQKSKTVGNERMRELSRYNAQRFEDLKWML